MFNQTSAPFMNESQGSQEDKRRHDRFHNNIGQIAEIDLAPNKANHFHNDLWALIVDESLGGCSLAVTTNLKLFIGQKCNVKFVGLNPFEGEIVWLSKLEANIWKVGVSYV
jgi:hypothetical protein